MEFYNIVPSNCEVVKFKIQGYSNIKFEHDSCIMTGKHFMHVYRKNGLLDSDLSVKYLVDSNAYNYISRKYLKSNKKGYFRNFLTINSDNCEYLLGGDCDFNFNAGKSTALRRKIDALKDISTENKRELLMLLQYCEQSHHKLTNFSLILETGGMQLSKGRGNNLTGDRFDKWLYKLRQFYKLNKEKRTIECQEFKTLCSGRESEPNNRVLLKYLNSFCTFENYVNQIYFISVELASVIISTNACNLTNYEELRNYMTNAVKYWDNKEKKLKDLY